MNTVKTSNEEIDVIVDKLFQDSKFRIEYIEQLSKKREKLLFSFNKDKQKIIKFI